MFSAENNSTSWSMDINATPLCERTEQGFLKVRAIPVKSCIAIYNSEELGNSGNDLYRMLFPLDELKKQATIDTLNEAPITDGHITIGLDNTDKIIGYTANEIKINDNGEAIFEIIITDEDVINKVLSKEYQDLSIGMTAIPVFQKGENELGEYDGYWTDIKVNHIALLPKGDGRLGESVKVYNHKLKEELDMAKKEKLKVENGCSSNDEKKKVENEEQMEEEIENEKSEEEIDNEDMKDDEEKVENESPEDEKEDKEEIMEEEKKDEEEVNNEEQQEEVSSNDEIKNLIQQYQNEIIRLQENDIQKQEIIQNSKNLISQLQEKITNMENTHVSIENIDNLLNKLKDEIDNANASAAALGLNIVNKGLSGEKLYKNTLNVLNSFGLNIDKLNKNELKVAFDTFCAIGKMKSENKQERVIDNEVKVVNKKMFSNNDLTVNELSKMSNSQIRELLQKRK